MVEFFFLLINKYKQHNFFTTVTLFGISCCLKRIGIFDVIGFGVDGPGSPNKSYQPPAHYRLLHVWTSTEKWPHKEREGHWLNARR